MPDTTTVYNLLQSYLKEQVKSAEDASDAAEDIQPEEGVEVEPEMDELDNEIPEEEPGDSSASTVPESGVEAEEEAKEAFQSFKSAGDALVALSDELARMLQEEEEAPEEEELTEEEEAAEEEAAEEEEQTEEEEEEEEELPEATEAGKEAAEKVAEALFGTSDPEEINDMLKLAAVNDMIESQMIATDMAAQAIEAKAVDDANLLCDYLDSYICSQPTEVLKQAGLLPPDADAAQGVDMNALVDAMLSTPAEPAPETAPTPTDSAAGGELSAEELIRILQALIAGKAPETPEEQMVVDILAQAGIDLQELRQLVQGISSAPVQEPAQAAESKGAADRLQATLALVDALKSLGD